MSEKPLNEYIDMEAYDVVSGEHHRFIQEREDRYREALQEIEAISFRQYLDWMHFHEIAMDKPFNAEDLAQDFARRISSLATIALMDETTIETTEMEILE